MSEINQNGKLNVMPAKSPPLQQIAANVPGVLFRFCRDVQGDFSFLYVSQGCRDLFELEPSEFIKLFDLVPSEDAEALAQALEESARSLTRFEHEHRIITPSGVLKWVKVMSHPQRQDDGSILWDGMTMDITAYKHTEEQLRLSDQRFQQFSANVPGVLYQFLLHPDGTLDFPFVSAGSLGVYGLKPQEMAKSLDLIHPDDRNGFQAVIQDSAQTGFPFEHQHRITTPSGVQKWVRVIATPTRQAHGNVLWDGLILDVTQQMRTEEQLRLSDQRFQQFSSNVPGVLYQFLLNPDGTMSFPFVSDGVRDMYELESTEMLQSLELIHPDDLADFQQLIEQSAQSLTRFYSEHRITTPSGCQKWVKVISTPTPQANGSILWDGLVLDVTERKQAEAQLQLSEQRFRQIFQSLPMLAMQIYDCDRRLVDWNDASTSIYGYTREEAIGQKLEDLIIPSEMQDTVVQAVDQWLTGGQPIPASELSLLHKDGSRVAVYSTHFLLPNAQGEPEMYCLDIDLRDRQAAEAELQRSKNLLELVINTLPGGVFFKDRDFNYLGCNQFFAQVAGVASPSEIIGKNDYDMPWKREESDFFRECDRRIIESGQAEVGIIEPLQHADGKQSWAETSKAPLRDEQGEVIGLVGMFQDVTEREAAAIALRQKTTELQETKDLLQLVINTLPGAVWWKDRHSVFQGCNEYCAQVAGFHSPDEMVGKSEYEMPWPKEQADFFVECDRRVMESGRAELGIIEPQLQADGKQAWLETNKAPLRNSAGEVIGTVGIFQDVTEREKAAIALRQKTTELEAALAELQTTKELLQLVINTLPGAVFWKDLELVYQGSNEYFAQIAGVKVARNIAGKTDYDLAWKTEEADFFQECDRRVIDSDVPELGIIEPQLQANGKQAWLETNKVPLRDSKGHAIGIVGMFQDVTEREEAAIALRQKTTELEQALAELQQTQLQLIQTEKMSSLGQMVAGVAHEINNPVTFIHGNITHAVNYVNDLVGLIELYQQTYPDPSLKIQDRIEEIDLEFLQQDFRGLVQSMRVGTERIREIVNSLRNFSRLDESAVKAVDLHEGINSTLTILQTRLRAQDWRPEIQIRREYGDLPLVECYAGQLNQVFMNIISNGIDALEERDRARMLAQMHQDPSTLTLRTSHNDAEICIEIQDNGPGMSAATRDRLFDPFFTTKPIGKGTGLGLSISYQIITEKHGGTLSCQSERGQGTRFIITLPL